MYDTIHFKIIKDDLLGGFTLPQEQHLKSVLKGQLAGTDDITQKPFFSGKLKNLRVSVTYENIYIKGSLSKYLKGTQLEPLTPTEVENGIQQLFQTLGLPPEKALVTRLDIAYNLETNYKPKAYFDFFGKLPRYRRLEQDNGIYYRIKKKQVLLYDKLKQMQRAKEPIPAAYEGINLLRFEVQFHKEILKQLNRPPVTAATLYDEVFYQQMKQEWAEAYYAIYKNRQFAQALDCVGGVISLKNYLMLQGIQALGGLNKLMKVITVGRITEKWSKKLRDSVQKKLFEIAETAGLTYVSPLVEELDQKVQGLAGFTPMCIAA